MPATSTRSTTNSGFTLIEVLVVSPLVILVIGVLVAAIISLTGKALTAQSTASTLGDIQGAFDSIERDIIASGQVTAATDTLVAPQGQNNTSLAFNTTNNSLVVRTPALTTDPLNDDRGLVYYANSPNACTDPSVSANSVVYVSHIYFVENGTLWRRTVLPADVSNACVTPWQVSTCATEQTGSVCTAPDSRLVEVGSGSLNLEFLKKDGTVLSPIDAGSAYSINVTIDSITSVAGREVTVSNSNHLATF